MVLGLPNLKNIVKKWFNTSGKETEKYKNYSRDLTEQITNFTEKSNELSLVNKEDMQNTLKLLNTYFFYLSKLKNSLINSEWPDPSNYRIQKTNPKLPVIIDLNKEALDDLINIIKEYVKEENKHILTKIKEIEDSLSYFLYNSEFYEIFIKNLEESRYTLINLGNQIKKSYYNIIKNLDSLTNDENLIKKIGYVKTIANAQNDAINIIITTEINVKFESERTSRLGVLVLMKTFEEHFNKILEIEKTIAKLKNKINEIDNLKDQYLKQAYRTVLDGLQSYRKQINLIIEKSIKEAEKLNGENVKTVEDRIIEEYAIVTAVLTQITDIKYRDEILEIMIENHNKKYDELDENTKKELFNKFKDTIIEKRYTKFSEKEKKKLLENIKLIWDYMCKIDIPKYLPNEGSLIRVPVEVKN